MVYVLLLGQLQTRAAALSAALAPYDKDAWDIADELRAEFDAGLVSEPPPESRSSQIMRELGVA